MAVGRIHGGQFFHPFASCRKIDLYLKMHRSVFTTLDAQLFGKLFHMTVEIAEFN